MLWANLPVVDTIHPQRNKFVTGGKIKVTSESKLNDSPKMLVSETVAIGKTIVLIYFFLSLEVKRRSDKLNGLIILIVILKGVII